MNAFIRKMSLRHPFVNLIVTISFLFAPGVVMTGYAHEEAVFLSAQQEKIARDIRMIKLYTVQEGKSRHLIIRPAELKKRQSIEVNGYVTGVLILGDKEMKMRVGGEEMSTIARNGDGSYSIKNMGRVGSGEIEAGSFSRGYSFFPQVPGDTVNAEERFKIELETDEGSLALRVRQVPYCTLRLEKDDVLNDGNSLTLQYLGCRLPDHKQNEDFDRRLDAIIEGIRSVEKTFRVKLVDCVRIIDYEKVRNAVTCEDKNDIWFYIRTFLEEPLEELRIIAQHETLHILVDRMNFTKDPDLRALFADLKGYETLSRERYALMTRGFTSAEPAPEKVFKKFFSFIDESNFLEGMKGGHSNSNLDEFCTSFLHSLMHIDRLYENFDRPIRLKKGKEAAFLGEKDKREVLDTYYRAIEVFLKAGNRSTNTGTHRFLLTSLGKALNLDNGLKSAEYRHDARARVVLE